MDTRALFTRVFLDSASLWRIRLAVFSTMSAATCANAVVIANDATVLVCRKGRFVVEDKALSHTVMFSMSSDFSYMSPDWATVWTRATKKPCSAALKA